jgi:hypothetical protein
MKANLIGFGLQRRWWPFLALASPHAAAGLLCEDGCSLSQHLRVDQTSDPHADVSEPTCLASKGQHPNLMKPAAAPFIDTAYRLRATVKPLLIAMRTASRRNSSVYRFTILYLLHSKHCSKETGTKPRQDHCCDEPK